MSQNMVKRRPAEPLFILLENYRAPRLTAGALFLSIADAERSKMTIFACTFSLTFENCLDENKVYANAGSTFFGLKFWSDRRYSSLFWCDMRQTNEISTLTIANSHLVVLALQNLICFQNWLFSRTCQTREIRTLMSWTSPNLIWSSNQLIMSLFLIINFVT